ncbi:hypothetical protein [Photorhabdus khanii]|uniref:Haem-binding uptake Tiki superfamily ChaN domain-containing protein n=1 Tax=Photorhabdus khanii subsp. guanajuatensis TaxID=2100166 RepID=A0A4R4K5E1_9GAMM|nr:hypothetical protein [Photorhabdus khanii]TDB62533.1 hypothetical protein C5467_02045 [Photorhabdus khanii subsp. guanajuatensis]
MENEYSEKAQQKQKRRQLQSNNATHHDSNPLELELGKNANSVTPAEHHKKWFTYEGDKEVELTTEIMKEIFSNKQPKIIIAGDGHNKPPFQYAKNIPDVNSSFDAGTLQLYIEATDEQINKNRSEYTPKEFMAKPSWFMNKNRRAGIVGWEDSELSNAMKEMFELSAKSISEPEKLTEKDISSFYELHTTAIQHFLPNFKQLSNEFLEIMAKAGSNKELDKIALEMMRFTSGRWRDEYINPTLAEKIAKHAAENENHTFVVSIGDAHLSINPMQEHLNKMRERFNFKHQIIFTRDKAPTLPII